MVSGRKVRLGLRILLLASLLSACTSAGSDSGAASVSTPASVRNDSCRQTPTQPESLPVEVRDWLSGSDTGVVGSGGLWVLIPDASWLEQSQDAVTGKTLYNLKLAWYRQIPGRLRVFAIRIVDLNNLEWATVHVPSGYPTTGFQPTGIEFPSTGCWWIVGYIEGRSSQLVSRFSVP